MNWKAYEAALKREAGNNNRRMAERAWEAADTAFCAVVATAFGFEIESTGLSIGGSSRCTIVQPINDRARVEIHYQPASALTKEGYFRIDGIATDTLFREMRLSVLIAVTDEVRVIKNYVQLWEPEDTSLRHFTFINGEVTEVDSAP